MRRPRLTPLRIAIALGALLSIVRFIGCAPLQRLDTRAVDLRLIERGAGEASPDVVIVAIDDASLAVHGRWPWPRSLMARLLERISEGDAAVVGFDVVQAEPSDAAEDRALAEAVRRSGRAVLGYFFDFDEPVPDPHPAAIATYGAVYGSADGSGERRVRAAVDTIANLDELTDAAAATGFFNLFPDPGDGVFRRVPMVVRYGEEFAMPLSAAMLQRHFGGAPAVLQFADFGVASVRIGDREIPVAEDGQMLVNYRGRRRTFEHVSAAELLDGRYRAERLRGKLVLVGVTASAVADVRSTPFDGVFPGVEIHATVLDNVLRADFLLQPKWVVLVEIAAVMAAALVLGLALARARGVMAAAVALALLGIYLGGTQHLFVTAGIPLGIVYPVFSIVLVYSAIALQHYVVEASEKRQIRSAFGRYLSPELARLVSERPEMLRLGGDKRRLTVLFSDIRSFTSISERLTPEGLVELLNVYLGEMTDVVFEHQGTLDKYIGDAIMAVWGAPVPHDDHAARACRAAVDMQDRLRVLDATFDEKGWPRLEIGVGVHTGEMVVGNMGSARRLSYTVIGDNVNIASRLEGLTKHYRARILASEDAVAEARGAVVVRELDRVRVKGKAAPVGIFEVLGHVGDERWTQAVEDFAPALELYRTRRWREALDRFERILERSPGDGPSELYAERCRAFLADPPPADWDAVTVMDSK